MAEKVYPSKPSPVGAAAAPNPPFPATKAQLYGANRPAYRPQPPRRHRHRRSCCCSFCIFLTLLVLALLFLAAILAAVLFLVYRPHRPAFAVSALKLSYLNVSQSSSTVSSKFDLKVTAKNPNKKLVYYYGPMTISVSSDGVDLGEGSFPSFVHGTKNTTLLETSITSGGGGGGGAIDAAPLAKLTSDMKSKSGLPLEVKLETKVKAKMGSLKTPKVQIRVTCAGIKVSMPSGNATATASTAGAKCKVRTRVKIWKWTF